MADLEVTPSPAESSPLSPSLNKSDSQLIQARVEELDESQSELLTRLKGLKTDLQDWRTTIDTHLKSYKDELSELKTRLHTELEQLTTDFQELKTTLQKQQDDVTTSLKNLGLQDAPRASEESEMKNKEHDTEKEHAPLSGGAEETKPADECST
ncbi:CAP-Gly domain-containing linker protein 1 [Iris pallida]|uniref:CAP-Gly domain-containing linker protein 1 n=1 Tax=Iris pallida TaxID=29817 RepID=A0AAX6GNN2_IRIPA|nr:CAP-Gly domain-containing linker protein 1 [Iris pallida]KAJ6844339.1 CAP-Gly domain-containing linker protein 1 [Iris pallida]